MGAPTCFEAGPGLSSSFLGLICGGISWKGESLRYVDPALTYDGFLQCSWACILRAKLTVYDKVNARDVHAQVPILPVFSDAILHTAGFLSQNLPPSLDTIVPPTYVRQVRIHGFSLCCSL